MEGPFQWEGRKKSFHLRAGISTWQKAQLTLERLVPLCQIPTRAARKTLSLSYLNQNVRTRDPHHKSCPLNSGYIILLALLSVGLRQPCACPHSAKGDVRSLFSYREKLS